MRGGALDERCVGVRQRALPMRSRKKNSFTPADIPRENTGADEERRGPSGRGRKEAAVSPRGKESRRQCPSPPVPQEGRTGSIPPSFLHPRASRTPSPPLPLSHRGTWPGSLWEGKRVGFLFDDWRDLENTRISSLLRPGARELVFCAETPGDLDDLFAKCVNLALLSLGHEMGHPLRPT